MDEKEVKQAVIVKHICQLPSSHLLNEISTPEQKLSWLSARVDKQVLAAAIGSRFLTNDVEFLRLWLDAHEISKRDYNLWWHESKWYTALWEVVVHCADYFKAAVEKAGTEYPFESDLHLYCYIVTNIVDGDFSICLEPYFEISRDKFVKAYQLIIKKAQRKVLSLDEEKFLERTLPERPELLWLTILLMVSEVKAAKPRDPLKSALEHFHMATQHLYELHATNRRKDGSVAFKNGHCGSGQVGGAYDFP